MRFVKATLLGLIAVSLGMMWSARDYVTSSYEQTPNTLELRLSGVDLAVTKSKVDPSPFAISAAPDTRRRQLAAMPAVEPIDQLPPVELTGGKARLRGTVVGPDGPIEAAVVGIERHTGHGFGTLRVSTNTEGQWSVGRLPGGRYRVRAWLPGLMTMGGSEVIFLADDEAAGFTFSLWGVDPQPTLDFIHAGPIYEGLSSTVAVAISQRTVDQEGLVVTTPVPGVSVSVQVSPDVSITSSPIQFTDHQGVARFVLACIPGIPVVPGVPVTPGGQPGVGASRAVDGQVPQISGQTTGQISGQTTGQTPGGPDGSGLDGPRNESGDGTLTARSGTLATTFALPGCQPIPAARTTEATDGDKPEGRSGG